jgi:hypothetical protein
MTLLTAAYAVLFYLATGVFVIGVALKIRSYASSPGPIENCHHPGAHHVGRRRLANGARSGVF